MKKQSELIIDEKNGVVVAITRGHKNDFLKMICRTQSQFPFCVFADAGKYEMPDEFRGVAKCCPTDKFDKEFGIKLATARMNEKYAHAFLNCGSAFIDDMNGFIRQMHVNVSNKMLKLSPLYREITRAFFETLKEALNEA